MVADQRDVDAARDEGLQNRPGFRGAEGVEAAVAQVRDARREAEPQQREQAEDVVRDAAAIGMVDGAVDGGTVMEQPVDDMGGLALGDRDRAHVERCVAIGDMGVERNGWACALVRVHCADHLGRAAEGKVLAVGTRRAPRAEHCGQGLGLLRIDDASEGQLVSLLTDVPAGGPCQLLVCGDSAGFGHAGQAKVGGVGQNGGHDGSCRRR